MELDEALEHIKKENDIGEAVKSVRKGLDNIADEAVGKIINPERWEEEKKLEVFSKK